MPAAPLDRLRKLQGREDDPAQQVMLIWVVFVSAVVTGMLCCYGDAHYLHRCFGT